VQVCPRLHLPQLLKLLEHFEPDEYAPERVPAALMASLRASAAASRIAAAVTVANGGPFDTHGHSTHDSAPSSPTTPSGNSAALLRAPRAAWAAPSPRDVAVHAGLLVDEQQHRDHSGDLGGDGGGSGEREAAAAWRAAR
jgi:hypothetical protein